MTRDWDGVRRGLEEAAWHPAAFLCFYGDSRVGGFAYGQGMGSECWGVRRAQALESALILHSEPGQAMDPTSSQYFHRYIQEIEFSGFCESLFSLLYSVRQRKKCLGPGH